MISSIDKHLSALYRLRRFGIKLGLTTISRLLRGLGNPQDRFPAIHIAGTNGKGSIAAFLSSVLAQGGYKVGLYTSPHLVRFNERIQINGCPISDKDLAQVAEAVQRIYAQAEPPTFFECATAMAFYYFASEGVDWAVLETGMGGRYDATNIVHPKASIISNISMEHQEYLGNTLAKIAREKAGIIKKGAGVVTGTRQKGPLRVIEQAAVEKGVPLYRLGKEIRIRKNKEGSFTYLGIRRRWPRVKIGLLGDHQITNAALALGTVELLQEKGLHLTDEAIYTGLASTRWPGRLEVASKEPFILLDGAHNPSAVRTLKKFLENTSAFRRLTLVLGILKDKAWKPMLRELADVADRIILTRPRYERAADPHELASFVRPMKQDLVIIPYLPDAISLALEEASPADAVCITGSLYMVGDAKAYLEGYHAPC
ncbi:MAG: bifunctional folylpolyglutamate synthase/dihydrofolate synthase [Deltaproteobacteria bacterium]|nr:bifunctional folylpolyglutamate synthase/dihydrofolate synthase [Deltaproteobacteria bacterium]MBW2018506.1 bifunctional folylpolyglutamate synthase/dihydrofolate synthase [Deltaproteobacteria bacterium]MBW2073241.1 bifunctional folylpolyglutamate synthase/dihydrofolate synthase [Deltaproteobacteria bacterium]